MPYFAGLGYSGDDPNNPNPNAAKGSFADQGFSGVSTPTLPPGGTAGGNMFTAPYPMDTSGLYGSGVVGSPNPMGIAGIGGLPPGTFTPSGTYAPAGMQAPSGSLPPDMGMKTMFSGPSMLGGTTGGNPTERGSYSPMGGVSVGGEPAGPNAGGLYNEGMGKDVSDATYQAATQYFEPDFTRDSSALETKLLSQGFAPGSEGYKNEVEQLRRSQEAARTGASLNAVAAGRAHALGVANLGLTARGQDNQMSQAELQGNIAMRGLGLNEDNMSFQQLMQLIASSRGGVPSLSYGTPTPIDVTGAYGINQSAANANGAARAAGNAGLYNLGATLLGSYFGR